MSPLVHALAKKENIISSVCITAQHRHMLDQVLKLFNVNADFDLDVMRQGQNLNDLTSIILTRLRPILNTFKPDLVLVHGDTTTTFASALSAYYEKIPVAHVEAGLRTHNIYSPWPEEANRKLTTCIANLHFAPTITSHANLISEGVPPESIHVTGNTVIDALLGATQRITTDYELKEQLDKKFAFLNGASDILLITGHRRENFGSGFESICNAVAQIAKDHPSKKIVYPVHLNPRVQEPVSRILSNIPNIHLLEPQEYLPFVYLMNKASIILTDSGGIQEEAPSLGKPVLVMRDTTERPEAVQAGTVKMVGTSSSEIVKQVSILTQNSSEYKRMSTAHNPYGDGLASERIAKIINEFLRDN